MAATKRVPQNQRRWSSLSFFYDTYPVYLLVLFGAIVPITLQALQARYGSYFDVGDENDQQRGIHTDNIVGFLTLVVAFATLATTSSNSSSFRSSCSVAKRS